MPGIKLRLTDDGGLIEKAYVERDLNGFEEILSKTIKILNNKYEISLGYIVGKILPDLKDEELIDVQLEIKKIIGDNNK